MVVWRAGISFNRTSRGDSRSFKAELSPAVTSALCRSGYLAEFIMASGPYRFELHKPRKLSFNCDPQN